MLFSLNSFIRESSDFIFWASALFGTMLFVLRLCTSIIGGADHELDEFDHAGAMGDNADTHHSSNSSFKLFTLHSISGFFMMFGWIGLACMNQLGYSHQISIAVAFFAGFMVMVLTGLIFKSAMLLVSTGTRFDIKKTVGLVGPVYQQIPTQGQGKIQLVMDGVTRELLAQSLDNCAIDSFKTVRVIRVLDHEVVIVKEINS